VPQAHRALKVFRETPALLVQLGRKGLKVCKVTPGHKARKVSKVIQAPPGHKVYRATQELPGHKAPPVPALSTLCYLSERN